MINIINLTDVSTINEALGITEERFSEMEDMVQQKFSKMFSEKVLEAKKNGKESLEMDSREILKCCEDVAQNSNETFMLGLMFNNLQEVVKKII